MNMPASAASELTAASGAGSFATVSAGTLGTAGSAVADDCCAATPEPQWRRLVLFDLDHTLIPFDSGMAWLRFLAERRAVEPGLPAYYEDCCRAYVQGRLELRALHRVAMAPLARHPFERLVVLRKVFALEAARTTPQAAQALVAAHRAAGDLCCVVTTTNEFVAAPFVRALGIDHLLGSVPRRRGGRLDGQVYGELCHGEAKPARVRAWLQGRGLCWDAFESSIAYSDSVSDLPLLCAAGEAVAVRPDAVLRAEAASRGWRIVEDLADAL
jgi:HAD superfamily hydrolase (TIGR01490 family)